MLNILEEDDCLRLLNEIFFFDHQFLNIENEMFNCIKKEKRELIESRLLIEKLEKY